jgi:hypothetical protein
MPYGFQIGKYTATIEMIGDADLTFKKIYIYIPVHNIYFRCSIISGK